MTTGTTRTRSRTVDLVTAALLAGRDTTDRYLGDGERGVVVTGPPGIGKSTLLDEVAARLTGAGVAVLRARADELSPRAPHALVRDLVGLPVALPPRAETAADVLDAVDARCAAGPVVLVVDDAHHADAASLDVLLALAAAARDLPLALLVARRPLPAREALDVLAARRGVTDVELGGLDPDELADLVRARWGAEPGPQLARWMDAAGGNPFHVRELLDDLDRRGRLHVEDGRVDVAVEGDALVAPPTLAASVGAHLGRLGGPAHDLVQALAVWGGPATVEQLAAVLGFAPAALLAPVQEAVTAGVVRWQHDGTLDVSHDLLREVTYDRLAPPLRAVLHRASAAVLRAGGAPATTITHHVGRAPTEEGSAGALQQAAAEIADAPQVAAELLGVAADLAAGDPVAADSIAMQRAVALARSGRWDRAGRVAREGIARTVDPGTRLRLQLFLVQCIVSDGDVTEALALLETAGQHITDPTRREELYQSSRWLVALARRDPLSAADLPDLDHLDDLPGVPASKRATALAVDTLTALVTGRFADGLVLARAAADAAARAAQPYFSDGATAQLLPTTATMHALGPARAAEQLALDLRTAEVEGRAWLSPYWQLKSAEMTTYTGRVEDAVAQHETALEAAEAAGVGWLTQGVSTCAAQEISLGRRERARARLDAWRTTGRVEAFGLPYVAHADALLAEADGDVERAARLVAANRTTTSSTGRLGWGLLVGHDLARIAVRAGDRTLLGHLLVDARAVDPAQTGMFTPVPALLAALLDADPDAAAAAADEFARWGHAPGEAVAWEETACLAAAAGHPRAREWATRAIELHQHRGAVADAQRASSRLRVLGVRFGVTGPRKRASTGWDSLTPTEQRIAELIGQGNPGPEIAALLVISPRTVQTHASRVLAKLGLRSRVELAAWMTRRAAGETGPD